MSGSLPASLNTPHPHDQMCAIESSRETCFAASAWSLATSNHADAGFRPSRPPEPGLVWNASMKPSFDGGMLIAKSLLAA